LTDQVGRILNRRPAVGLAIGVVRNGRLDFFHGHGVADLVTRAPVTERTVFRIASLTKLFTAIAVMQLEVQGLVDLDAPAADLLRTYRLVPADPGFPAATLRHLLTHTAGVPEVLQLADVFHPSWGPFFDRPAVRSVPLGEPLPSLGECYRDGLPVKAEPGTVYCYSNHGFATLGQIVEDVSGEPLDRYFRDHLFGPLGMADTTLGTTAAGTARRATGYVVGRDGPTPVVDRDWASRGASNLSSTTTDLARFAAALLGGGAGELGSILRPETLAAMFEPHFRPDARLPGMGLGFFRVEECGLRAVEHSGVLPGFHSHLIAAPHDGVAIVALTNGSPGAFVWMPIELRATVRRLVGLPDAAAPTAACHRPEAWGDLCGTYRLPPGSDLRGRAMMGGGVRIFVGGGRLRLRVRAPLPALLRGMPLLPDDPVDPEVFRLDLSGPGMGSIRVVFGRDPTTGERRLHTDLGGEPLWLARSDGHRSSTEA
jgi:CubicO group peptidase (beta-lactamase class C family)